MGGDYYEREVQVAASSSQSYSDQATKALTQSSLHKSNDPKRFSEDNRQLLSTHKNPIVFALDVSGSMGDWPKIIYDKLPMFYGQIMMQGYITDPSVSFCAVDDTHDRAPLQVTDFGQGVQIDQLISKIYLESGGSGEESRHEAYELSAYLYLRHCQLDNVEIPYFFITGDEHFYQKIKASTIQQIMGYTPKSESGFFKENFKKIFGKKNEETISSIEIWKELKKKFNVFHLHKPYSGSKIEKNELNDWIEALGTEWILEMQTPKACIDVILGVIALTSGARTMEEYIKDMEARGQSKERIEEVTYSLRHLTKDFLKNKVLKFKGEEKKIVEEKLIAKEEPKKKVIEEEEEKKE